MVIVSAADRIEKYEAFLNSNRLPANLLDYKAVMLAKYSAWVSYLVPLEVATSEYLLSQLIPGYLIAFYQSFMRAAARLKVRDPIHKIPLDDKDVLFAVWMARGLNEDLIEYIFDAIVDTVP